MESSPKLSDPRLLAKLEGLELRARRAVEGYVSGLHSSPFRGFSVEFAEHREYVPGDDLRFLDWKVFGRSDKFYLKQFEEETNLVVYLVVDVSRSMTFRSPDAPWSKLECASCMAASLAYLVLKQQDSAGLATVDDQIRSWVRPAGHPPQFKQIVRTLETAKPTEKTGLGALLHRLAEQCDRRGLVVLVSDLFEDPEKLTQGLRHFRHRKHDLVVFQVADPAEIHFPYRDATLFRGLEGEPPLLTDPRGLRSAYLKAWGEFQQGIQRACRSHGADYALHSTDQPLDRALTAFLSKRLARRT